MSVDLLLINPGGRKNIYQNLASELSAIEPPVWAGLMAGFVQKHGFSVSILDANAEDLVFEDAARRALEFQPKLIAVIVYGHNPSASTQVMPGAGAICRVLKNLNPDIKILLAGGHVTALPEQTLREEAVDFVSDGEGPATLLGLLKLLGQEQPDFETVPDLWHRKNGQITPPKIHAPLIQNLDQDFPGIPWDLLPMEKYRAHNWHCFGGFSRKPYAALYTTLGCPYRCEFCCIQSPFRTGERASGLKPQVSSYRFWSPAWVVRQIDTLVKNYGVRNIKFADEMFVLNRAHVLEICNLLIERDYGLNLWAYARVDTAKDPTLLATLKKAGFNWLVLGIEAADPKTRKDVDKKFQQEDIYESVRQVQAAGIDVLANYIFGLPEDTRETLQQTLDLALDLNTEFANFYCAMAYPGSALYQRAREENWAISSQWERYSQHAKNTLPIQTRYLTAAEVVKFRDEAFQIYFRTPSYRDMIQNKFGKNVLEEIHRMTSHPLERELIPQE